MKKLSQHTRNEIFSIAAFLVLMTGIVFIAEAMNPVKSYKKQWDKFEKCIKSHPSDGVCDSCYTAIFKR